jgi:SRSO17 transposase
MRTRESTQATAGAPPSGRPPGPLAGRDAETMAEALVAYHAQFHDLFARREQREWSAFYLHGQLSALERKTVEPMVLAFKGDDRAAVRAVQQFLGEGAWDDTAILARREALVAEDLGAPDGLLIADGSGFPKQGTHSVGVARQYCGHVGKIANSQQGVFLAYASAQGCTFVDRRLYMPAAWFDDEHAPKRARCGVPSLLRFRTEPALALAMIRGVLARGVLPVRWVLADETYGADAKFLDGVAALARWYFVEVPVITRAWVGPIAVEPPGQGPMGRPRTRARVRPGTPKPQEVRDIAAALSPQAWRRYVIKEGAKGALAADFAFVRVTRAHRGGRPGAAAWLVIRRGLTLDADGKRPHKYFLTNAPADRAREELARLSGARWPIEVAFEEAKGELGMDHYEVRTWRGWHHHMTQTFLAHHLLLRLRVRGEKPGAHARPGEATARRRPARTGPADPRPGTRHRTLPSGTELRRVLLTRDADRGSTPTPTAA